MRERKQDYIDVDLSAAKIAKLTAGKRIVFKSKGQWYSVGRPKADNKLHRELMRKDWEITLLKKELKNAKRGK